MGVVLRRCLAIALAMSGSVWSAALAADMPPWFATSTDAQGLPAVDGFNAKVSSFGGSLDGQATFGGEGSISVPLGYRFGFQLDGLVSGIDSRHHGDVTVAATGAHMFWRDPAVGLLGAYGRYFHADAFSGVNLYIAAAQGALYNGRFTLEGIAGVESGNVALDGFGSRTLDAHFVDVVKLSYYPTDNLKLTVGHSYSAGHALFPNPRRTWLQHRWWHDGGPLCTRQRFRGRRRQRTCRAAVLFRSARQDVDPASSRG